MASAQLVDRVTCASAADYLSPMHIRSILRGAVGISTGALFALAAPQAQAQASAADTTHPSLAPIPPPHYKLRFAAGFVTSILAHESGHIIASYAVGGHPSFGFNHWRPTLYSGIDSRIEPHKQFIFSSAGLTVQTLLDETLLDMPHARGSIAGPFERGANGRFSHSVERRIDDFDSARSGKALSLYFAQVGRVGLGRA